MAAHYDDLAGKCVFISGGATGIGLDLVTGFHRQGSKVVFVDIDAGAGETLRDKLAAEGAAPLFIVADVTDDSALKAALEAAEALGGLDVLVNNAANDTRQKLEDIGPAAWAAAVDINLRHQFVAAQIAAGWMKPRRRGAIVNFGSIAPEMIVPDLAVYNMCKAGVRGLTRSLARDLGPFGIRVNNIMPGAILTPRQRALWFPDQAAIDEVVAGQCLPLELNGGHVANMALFLASDAAAGCTAQDFIVDAGTI
ncbi:MAG: SDR family oxidoreductase [Paracoccaceae bacterium]